MQTRFSESTSISAAQLGGLRVAAKIMDKIKSEDASEIFAEMRADDENLVLSIEDNMFDFADLVNLADRDIQTMINNFEEEELRTALKGAEEELMDKFKGNMSKKQSRDVPRRNGPHASSSNFSRRCFEEIYHSSSQKASRQR
jgi:flagellar motor switch protein FliG